MNSITFYVDMSDNAFNCYYKENYTSKQSTRLFLSNETLSKVFLKLIKNFPEPKVIEEKDYNIVTFYDVDVDLTDDLLKRSDNHKKAYNEKTKNAKVVRKNNFKKTVVKVSAGALASLMIFVSAKEALAETFPIFKRDDIVISQIEEEQQNEDKLIEFLEEIDKSEDIKNEETHDELFPSLEDISIQDKEVPPIVNIPEIKEIEETPDNYIFLATENMINSDKYLISNSYYSESLTKIALRYGVDPNLALAVATHERGKHSDVVDAGGAIGLFQIQVEGGWNWNNKTITAYNFETNQYEDFLITTEAVSDVFVNMQVGCMMLQNLLRTYDYNVAKSVTAYNYGSENLRVVLEKCAAEENISMEEFNDPNNIQWLKYRDIISGGDPQYLENVFKYIPDGTVLNFTKPNGEVVTIEYDNLYEENNSSFTQ